MPQSAVGFLRNYLPRWNGRDHQSNILALLEFIPVQDYDDLYEVYFHHIEVAVLNDSVQGKSILLRFYTNIIRHWGGLIRSAADLTSIPPLSDLIPRAELLSLTLLEVSLVGDADDQDVVSSPCLQVLHFYTELAQLFSHAPKYSDIPITVPISQVIYHSVFVTAVCHVSLLGAVLATYKSALEILNQNATSDRVPQTDIIKFNGYVLDACNLLWRNRALNADDPNALGCLVPAETVAALTRYIQELNNALNGRDQGSYKYKFRLVSMFSLSHNPALCRASSDCVSSLEDEAEKGGQTLHARLPLPVTQEVLSKLGKDGGITLNWQEYRLRMLEWLDAHGSKGIGALMRSAMINLRKT